MPSRRRQELSLVTSRVLLLRGFEFLARVSYLPSFYSFFSAQACSPNVVMSILTLNINFYADPGIDIESNIYRVV